MTLTTTTADLVMIAGLVLLAALFIVMAASGSIAEAAPRSLVQTTDDRHGRRLARRR